LLEKIHEALYFYGRPEHWQKIQHNGMLMDNSWEAAAAKYLELYQEIAYV
jgi:starch synthase